MKDKFINFTNTKYYIMAIFGLTYLSWLGGQYVSAIAPIGLMLLITIGALILFFATDTTPLMPIVCSCLFIIGTRLSWDTWPIWIIIIPAIFAICLLVFFIKNRIKLTLGKMSLGLIFLLVAGLLPVIRVLLFESYLFDAAKIFFSLAPLLTLLLYTFFHSTIKGNVKEYFANMLVYVGILVAAQLLTKYIQIWSIDAIMADKKVLDLGWGISNDAAIYMNLAIFMTCYFLTKAKSLKDLLINLAILIFLGVCVLLTWSRMGLLALGIMMIPAIVIIFIKSAYRKQIIIGMLTAFAALVLAMIIKPHLIVDPIVSMLNKGIDLSGRDALYSFAIELFKQQPIIGYSMFPMAPIEVYLNANIDPDRMVVFHSIFYQTIATMGIIGVLALLYHFFEFGRLLINKRTLFKAFVAIAIGCSLIHNIMDNVYFMVIFMTILSMLLAVVENDYSLETIEESSDTSKI